MPTRERFLTREEIRLLWHATADLGDYGRIFRLLLLTGCRRDEIARLQWAEVNFGQRQIELPKERVKNKRPHVVPLSDLALAQLPPRRDGHPFVFGGGRSGFSGFHVGEDKLASRVLLEPRFTLHDLRRTFVTEMNERGLAEPHIVEACINHASGHKAGVAGCYNRAAYAAQKRAALERWADELARIVGA